MVKLVSFYSSKFSSKFVEDKIISLIPIIVVENNWVPKVHSVREEIRDRENVFDVRSSSSRHIFTKKDRGLLKVGDLAIIVAEVIRYIMDVGSQTIAAPQRIRSSTKSRE
jgi:hypothetical protein